MVSFNQIPADLMVPLFYAETDNSQAGGGLTQLRRLIIGQVNSDVETDGALVLVSGSSQAAQIGGPGSMLHAMHTKFRNGDPLGEIWCLPVKLADGSAAAGKVTLSGVAGEPGLLSLYIGGKRIRATVPNGGTAAAMATALAAAISASTDSAVLAVAAGPDVMLTSKWLGLTGNDIQLEMNRLGSNGGEKTPSGLTVAITAMAGGTGSPEMPELLAAVGDEEFDFIVQPYTDTSSLDALRDWMNDISGRWAYSAQLYGHVYSARRGTLGESIAFGRARNDPHITINTMEVGMPEPLWENAAASAARNAVFISADPARPTQTGELVGINPAPAGQRFLLNERQSLLSSGMATSTYNGGAVRIERAVTTYQRNAYGQTDRSYLDSETLHQTAYILRFLKGRITSKYGRHKLADDGTKFGAGQAIVTPNVIRGELVAGYAALEYEGIVENAELFNQYLIVERDTNSPNRVNILFPPDYVNQLRVFALLNQFRLQYPAEA